VVAFRCRKEIVTTLAAFEISADHVHPSLLCMLNALRSAS
jgi:hypothetical protein